jgi:flagellar motor switch protein FliN/FliY
MAEEDTPSLEETPPPITEPLPDPLAVEPTVPLGPDLTPVGDVVVTASVEVGRRELKINEALSVTVGTIIQLDRAIDMPLDLLLNGHLVARGEVVVVDNEFGLRIVEILPELHEKLG